MSRPVQVRVVESRNYQTIGLVIALVGMALAALQVGGLFMSSSREGAEGAAASAAIAGLFWAAGLLLTSFKRPPYVRMVQAVNGVIYAGGVRVSKEDKAKVIRGKRGYSIATPNGFLEVEHRADVKTLMEGVGLPETGSPFAAVTTNYPIWQIWKLAVAIMIFLGALVTLLMRGYADAFSIHALLAGGAFITTLFFLVERFSTEKWLVGVHGAEKFPSERVMSTWSEHLALHSHGPFEEGPELPPDEKHILTRGNETTLEWLTRVDQIGAANDGYRGNAMTREELWRIVEDATVPEDARVAAARILTKRDGAKDDEIYARVAQEALHPRFRVAMQEDLESAVKDLDELGPAFRAIRR